MITTPDQLTIGKEADVLGLLQRSGIVSIPGYLTEAETQTLKRECVALLDHQATWVIELPYSIGKAVRVIRTQIDVALFPSLVKTFSDSFMQELTDAYLGLPNRCNYDLYMVKDIPGSTHVAQRAHYDRVPHLKFFIYLTDVSVHNGPLYCIPGTQGYAKALQQANRELAVWPGEEEVRQLPLEDYGPEIAITGSAGTLIIFDSDVFHRASTLEESERLVIRSRCLPAYVNVT